MFSGLSLCLLLAAVLEIRSDKQIVTVNTTTGVINGFVENVTFLEETSTLHMFLGIPFAEPPVGQLRFKKPVPKSPLTEPLDAFVHKNACMQLYKLENTTYSEDCLYLNIYAPEREKPNETLPVMIWIYGGGFNFGESNSYIADRLSIHGDVIVVTLNYRVSLFGFLTTGDDASPGNYGLWDQRLAIEWVHNNIAVFGGDPNNVTIFGQSAGSASVIYQGLYHRNFGLFQRIIAQSGSIMGWWAITDKGPYYATKVGSLANCSTKSSESIVTCLRTMPADQLINLFALSGLPIYIFVPTIDNDFITYDPHKVFDSDDRQSREATQFLASLDLLTGVSVGEGAGGLDPMFGVSDIMNFLPNRTDFENRLVPLLIKEGYGDDIPSALNKAIIAEYTNWTDPRNSNNIRDEYMRMHADFTYNAQLYKTLDTHSDAPSTSRTYMYFLDTEPDTRVMGDMPWYKKAFHGEDLPLVFGFRVFLGVPFPPPAEWEIQLSATTMTLWTNFAKSGDPNSPVDLGFDWKSYTTKGQHYLQMTQNMSSANVKQRWNIGAPYFWLDVVPSIIQTKSCDKTYPEITSSAGSMFLSGVRLYAEFCILSMISFIYAVYVNECLQ